MTYIDPVLPLLICLFVLGLTRRVRSWCGDRNYVLIAAVACLFLWSWSPVAWLTSASLERWYPVSEYPSGDAQVIVVLSGGMYDPYPSQPQALMSLSTHQRIRHAAWLHNNWKPLPVLASGGPAGGLRERLVIADLMKEALAGEGVPAWMIWTERRSLNTHENAVYSAELLRDRGVDKVALVTNGSHMLRAERCFRKQGLDVVPVPSSCQHLLPLDDWREFIPNAEVFQANDSVLHEWVGLAWYWLRGRI